MSDINIDYDAAIDEALKEAAENEASMVTELEPDPVAAGEETVQEEGEAEEMTPETLEGGEGLQEEGTVEAQEETDPPSIEERLDDLMELVGGLHDLLKQLITGMEAQSQSIDSIGARVIDAVTTVLQHGGAKASPVKPPVPAPDEKASEKGPSEAEQANLQTIQALKERRS